MRSFVPLTLLAVVLGPPPTGAQPATSPLGGFVVDRFGDPIADADVTAESASGYLAAAVTDAAGTFLVPELISGLYRVTADREGFIPALLEVDVGPGTNASDVRLVLEPSSPATVILRVVDPQGLALPGAAVLASGPAGEAFEAVTAGNGSYTLPDARPGTWTFEASLPGFGAGSAQATARFGSGAEAEIRLDLDYSPTEDVVVLGSQRPVGRRTVRLVDSAVSTTVVPGEVIENTAGLLTADALRTAPALNVIQLSARDVQMTTRESTSTLSNSQLVLLDGRSIYLDFFGTVLWDMLPVNPGDIEQIEVVRGPASATWGANAMTGAVHVITKPPRETVGGTLTMSGGWIGRDAGSMAGRSPGSTFGTNATVARAPSDTLSYRLSAGYFASDALPRPVGAIPVVNHPRDPGAEAGGALFPLDGEGPAGTAFRNTGTSQPKFDFRVDKQLGAAEISWSGGISASTGTLHGGLGPFQMQPGSYLGYGKMNYTRGDLRFQVFTNLLRGDAASLLFNDGATAATAASKPYRLVFTTRTLDADIGDTRLAGSRHLISYGGNVRHNSFDLSAAPLADPRTELGAYLQDEIFADPFRFTAGIRADRSSSLRRPFFSPRLAAMYKPNADHSITLSYNRAFRSPSALENFLDLQLATPVDFGPLAAAAPLLPLLLPPDAAAPASRALTAFTARPFPLVTNTLGAPDLHEESLTAYEAAYSGIAGGAAFGASVYTNRRDGIIRAIDVPAGPGNGYTSAEPPPGWPAPLTPLLDLMAAFRQYIPRVARRFGNLGPLRSWGVEGWLDQQAGPATLSLSYSWQSEPRVLDPADPSAEPFPVRDLTLPPTHRFTAGVRFDRGRYLGNAVATAVSKAFWADVLTPDYFGWSDGYTTINGTFGVRWKNGRMTTLVKVANLLNRNVRQHVFGDILKRSVVGELRFRM